MANSNQSRNAILGVLAVLILGVAVVIYVYPWEVGPKYPDKMTIYGVSLETGEDVVLTVDLPGGAPYEDPDSGKACVYPWHYCFECRHRFVHVPGANRPSEDATTKPSGLAARFAGAPICPLCNSTQTGAWIPDDEEMKEPAGDAPLPELP